MAEGEEQKSILHYVRGLFKDTGHIDQPQGTVRFLRNGIMSSPSGAISNEGGTVVIDLLPYGSVVIGSVATLNKRIILCLKIGLRSEIGVFQDGVYSTYLNLPLTYSVDTDLKFSIDFPISGEYKQQSDGDLIFYWTDDHNPPRAINLTRQKLSSPSRLYGVDPASSPDTKYINMLNLFPHAGPVPHIELLDVVMGGACKTAVYYLASGYTDEDITSTNYTTVANPVSIVDEIENVNPIESYDGAPPNILTGKAISWRISNINTDYKYLRLAVLIKKAGVLTAIKLKDIEISNRSIIDMSYTGSETNLLASVDEVTVDDPEYDAIKAIRQLDNVLYLGNLKGSLDLGYQCFANYIRLKPKVKKLDPFDPVVLTSDFLNKKKTAPNHPSDRSQGYRDSKNIYNYKGYTREEVYAFYIAFVLKSGNMSYAYHIPGRDQITNIDPSLLREDTGITGTNLLGESTLMDLYGGNGADYDLISIAGINQARFYQWYDFSHLLGTSNMNFWMNLNEKYPDSPNYDICNASSPTQQLSSLRGKNVRHHKFPSNTNFDFTTVKSSNSNTVAANISGSVKVSVHWYWFGEYDTDGGNHQLTGKFPNQDFNAARAFQAPFNPNNEGMGGTGSTNANVHQAQDQGANSCLPETNDFFNNPFVYTSVLRACVAANDAEVEFVYDTNIPAGVRAVVQWDAPWGVAMLGHCSGRAIVDVTSVNFEEVNLSFVSGGIAIHDFPPPGWEGRPGYIAWVECETVLSDDTKIEHEVQALGFQLSDLKIPKSIADKIQGFRIYYAERTHENRTMLGQNPIHPMMSRRNMDISGCDGQGISVGRIDYWLPPGLPARTLRSIPRDTFSFHDFYLLNRTPNLSNATHIKLQYILGMFNFKGPTRYYYEGSLTNPYALDPSGNPSPIYSCFKPQVQTSFHMSGNHYIIQGQRLNYAIKDKAKKYILGNTIYEGATDGFEKSIYNIGGETHLALRTNKFLPFLVSDGDSVWRTLRSDKSGASYVNYTDNESDVLYPDGGVNKDGGLQLHMADLKAFKTDVYNALDSQNLVWTGYEITGNDVLNFVVDENGNPIQSGATFMTGDIFGGDTFICRYGYRMTHREEVDNTDDNNNRGLNKGSIDHKSVIFTIVESTENINFRHIENNSNLYFPGASLADTLALKADVDLSYNPDTTTGNMKYNEDYSSVNNVKQVAILPFQLIQPTDFSTAVIRSGKASELSLVDNYRRYSISQLKSLNNNRGELWNILAYNNILLFQMEQALYKTKGKQTMQTDTGSAFVGSGDIFDQEPDDVKHTDAGYLGTLSKYAGIVTPFGYFFVDNRNRRVFLIGQETIDLSSSDYGMEDWFSTNIPYHLEQYEFNGFIDNPIKGIGFHAVWDEKYSRIILTKRDLKPTQAFINGIANQDLVDGTIRIRSGIVSIARADRITGQVGWTVLSLEEGEFFTQDAWTISFAVNLSNGKVGAWESFHDYTPYHYSYVGTDVYSFVSGISPMTDRGIHRHNNVLAMCQFYGVIYPFEVEVVHNESNHIDKLCASIEFISDTFSYDSVNKQHRKELNAGFTSFLLYNTNMSSGVTPLEYMVNMRKTSGSWAINQFRDMSAEIVDGTPYYTGPFNGGQFNVPGLGVSGTFPSGTNTSAPLNLINVNGMYEVPNPLYVDVNKPWYNRGNFTDRFIALRLIADNSANKLINLYSTLSNFKIFHR